MKNILFSIAFMFFILPVIAAYDTTAVNAEKDKIAITIGFLKGGGALIGFDAEAMLGKNFGVQAGFGLSAFGAGINYHLKPRLNSSFFSFSYWHQGINVHSQSLLGPSFVFRPKKIFAAQLGLGYVLNTGPGLDKYLRNNNMERADYPPFVLMYSVGFYFLSSNKPRK